MKFRHIRGNFRIIIKIMEIIHEGCINIIAVGDPSWLTASKQKQSFDESTYVPRVRCPGRAAAVVPWPSRSAGLQKQRCPACSWGAVLCFLYSKGH